MAADWPDDKAAWAARKMLVASVPSTFNALDFSSSCWRGGFVSQPKYSTKKSVVALMSKMYCNLVINQAWS